MVRELNPVLGHTIGVESHVLAITFSFLINKCLMLRMNWQQLHEYVRHYLVLSSTVLLSIALLWFLVGELVLAIWLA